MSLEAYAKVFFGPRAPSTAIEPQPKFLKPGKEGSQKTDKFQPPQYSLKHLHQGHWRPKPLARPSFLLDKVETKKSQGSAGEIETAKLHYSKAEGEAEKAKAEYEKLANTAKAYEGLGNKTKAKAFAVKAEAAKKKYEQKALAVKSAKGQMEKTAAKHAKPSSPIKGLAPSGEELSGPTGLTLAKNHAMLSGGSKGAV